MEMGPKRFVDRNDNANKKGKNYYVGSSVIVQTIECLLIQSHVKFFLSFFFFSRLVVCRSAASSAWRHCIFGKWGFCKGRDQKTPSSAADDGSGSKEVSSAMRMRRPLFDWSGGAA